MTISISSNLRDYCHYRNNIRLILFMVLLNRIKLFKNALILYQMLSFIVKRALTGMHVNIVMMILSAFNFSVKS